MIKFRDFEINIPTSVNEMRIKHVKFFLELSKFKKEDLKIKDICRLNEVFTGISYNKLVKFSKESNVNLFDSICKACNYNEPTELPLDLTFETPEGIKQKYTFREDFTKLPASWFIDLDSADLEENPVLLASFCYIEEGLTYGQEGEHGNIINMLSGRNEVFEKHFPLSIYLTLQAFFLLKWNAPSLSLIKTRRLRRAIKTELEQDLNGKRQLII